MRFIRFKRRLAFPDPNSKYPNVSNTGINTIPRTNIGACVSTGLGAKTFTCSSRMQRTAITKPSTSEPVSPINILAGLKLKYRKANMPPANAKATSAVLVSPLMVRNIPRVIRLIKDRPPARPSIPSIRLKALVIPTIARIVKLY